MKRLLLIALAILPGLQGTFDLRASSFSPVEKGIGHPIQALRPKAKNTGSSGEDSARRFVEKNKASSNAAGLYDTLMPLLCLLMLIYFSLSIRKTKNRNVP